MKDNNLTQEDINTLITLIQERLVVTNPLEDNSLLNSLHETEQKLKGLLETETPTPSPEPPRKKN